MRLEEWFEIYRKIISDFNFSPEKDDESARLMHRLGKGKLLDSRILEEIISGREVAVVGGAVTDSIESDVIITAGKAIIKWIKLSDRLPDIHVTDMEESDDILLSLEENRTVLVLHAHGDNMDRVKSVVPKLTKFIGTTQNKPFNKIYNFGGFTDGDRAAIIAKKFGAEKIVLHGFNFDYRKGIKGKKLYWAKKILEMEGLI